MNTFKQNSNTYCIELKVKFKYLQSFVSLGEEFSKTIVYFEAENTKNIDSDPEDLWQIDIYFENKPDFLLIKNAFNSLAFELKIQSIDFLFYELDDKDWVSEVQKQFSPLKLGKFFIHNLDYKGECPAGLMNIQVNAGRAFGTGEHETTSGCLVALSEYLKGSSALDMGCGSGILAIAMAKLGSEVVAVDLDEQAVLVTKENAELNAVRIKIIDQSDGYNSNIVRKNAPYNTIVANILAGPLIEMAKDAFACLAKDGIIILAGLIEGQMKDVLDAHIQQGFKLEKIIQQDNWPVLIMSK